jgi:hypothetical protein
VQGPSELVLAPCSATARVILADGIPDGSSGACAKDQQRRHGRNKHGTARINMKRIVSILLFERLQNLMGGQLFR